MVGGLGAFLKRLGAYFYFEGVICAIICLLFTFLDHQGLLDFKHKNRSIIFTAYYDNFVKLVLKHTVPENAERQFNVEPVPYISFEAIPIN